MVPKLKSHMYLFNSIHCSVLVQIISCTFISVSYLLSLFTKQWNKTRVPLYLVYSPEVERGLSNDKINIITKIVIHPKVYKNSIIMMPSSRRSRGSIRGCIVCHFFHSTMAVELIHRHRRATVVG